MVGNNSASVVADAWLKGLRGYDIETLWEAVKLSLIHICEESFEAFRNGTRRTTDWNDLIISNVAPQTQHRCV